MAKYIKLSDAQKDEIRRLTQLANRRIKAAAKVYEKAGMERLPRDVVGDIQTRDDWHTKNTPLSRSVKFESMEDYRKQLHMLRRFEHSRPNMTEYTEIQRDKTKDGILSSVGQNAPPELVKLIDKMTAPQLAQFWREFSLQSARLGMKYSSTQALAETLKEIFPQDVEKVATGLATDISKGDKLNKNNFK